MDLRTVVASWCCPILKIIADFTQTHASRSLDVEREIDTGRNIQLDVTLMFIKHAARFVGVENIWIIDWKDLASNSAFSDLSPLNAASLSDGSIKRARELFVNVQGFREKDRKCNVRTILFFFVHNIHVYFVFFFFLHLISNLTLSALSTVSFSLSSTPKIFFFTNEDCYDYLCRHTKCFIFFMTAINIAIYVGGP